MLGAWTKIVAHGFEELGTPNQALAAAIAEEFAARRWEVMCLFPGTVETLGRLRERGVTMALVTNGDKTQQRRKIERYDLAVQDNRAEVEGSHGSHNLGVALVSSFWLRETSWTLRPCLIASAR